MEVEGERMCVEGVMGRGSRKAIREGVVRREYGRKLTL